MSTDSSTGRRIGVKSGSPFERKLNATFVKKAPAGRYCDGGGPMLHVYRTGLAAGFFGSSRTVFARTTASCR